MCKLGFKKVVGGPYKTGGLAKEGSINMIISLRKLLRYVSSIHEALKCALSLKYGILRYFLQQGAANIKRDAKDKSAQIASKEEKKIEGYQVVNRFFQKYIEHVSLPPPATPLTPPPTPGRHPLPFPIRYIP